MTEWILRNITEIMGTRPSEAEIDIYLLKMKNHSLKMITFLARFNREFGRGPRVIDFITSPSVETLQKSVPRSLDAEQWSKP